MKVTRGVLSAMTQILIGYRIILLLFANCQKSHFSSALIEYECGLHAEFGTLVFNHFIVESSYQKHNSFPTLKYTQLCSCVAAAATNIRYLTPHAELFRFLNCFKFRQLVRNIKQRLYYIDSIMNRFTQYQIQTRVLICQKLEVNEKSINFVHKNVLGRKQS